MPVLVLKKYVIKDDVKPSAIEIDRYMPLIALVAVNFFASFVLNFHAMGGLKIWMHYFMGLFFCSFAMLKFFDLKGFADGFQMYDIIAKRFRVYAYIYPFIELELGLSYLTFAGTAYVAYMTILVMLVSMAGVITALNKGINTRCACMGTTLNVPLSTVTLTEDVAMLLMATLMLYI